jgi:hypothetical protein
VRRALVASPAALCVLALAPAPANAATRSCPRVAIQPNSGNLASKVRATNTSCRTARRVILGLRRDGVRRPSGYRCSSTQIGDGIMGELRYVCTNGRRQIRWSI